MKDRNTTVLGVAAILTAVGSLLTAMFDSDPATVADWGTAAAAVIAGVGLIFAKDSKGEGA